jgi:broad specificity phosphatase PhoE
VQFVATIAGQHPGGVVLAATHDSPVRMVASLALGLDDSRHNDQSIRTPVASVTIVETGAGGSIALRLHNDIEHLRGLDDGA